MEHCRLHTKIALSQRVAFDAFLDRWNSCRPLPKSCTQLNRRWRIYLATGKRISHLPITLDKLL
jgi:hypothetical protein